MSTITIPHSLETLVQFLNEQQSRVPIDSLREHLLDLQVTLDDLAPYMQFGDTCYRRNLICQGEWYELLCLCWRNGQKSLIHNHAGSTCGLRIMSGAATETTFVLLPDGRVRPNATREYEPGLVCCTQDADIHQVCNLQPNGQDLVTLHIYSPPLVDMQTWECDEAATVN
jgi:cysteine dioxygenase